MNPQQASLEYLAAEIEKADPLRRIVLLHEGAVRFTREAITHVERRDFPSAHRAFVKAKRIVAHLLASIPEDDTSDLAANLRGLFKFAYLKLAEANFLKDTERANQALQVIRNLADGWAGLEQKLKPPKTDAQNKSLDDIVA